MTGYCKNLKPDGSFCMVPIEWREIGVKPDGSPKKRPFETDTGNQHECPYYNKKPVQNFKKVAQSVEQEIISKPPPKDNLGIIANEITEIRIILERLERSQKEQWEVIARHSYTTAKAVEKDEGVIED